MSTRRCRCHVQIFLRDFFSQEDGIHHVDTIRAQKDLHTMSFEVVMTCSGQILLIFGGKFSYFKTRIGLKYPLLPRTKVPLGSVAIYMIYISCLVKNIAREKLLMAAVTPR